MTATEKVLRKPYTHIVIAILIVVLGLFAGTTTPTDVFPNIDIPVVTVIWTYGGASPDIMEKRIVSNAERSYSAAVNDIQHMESQSMPGISIIKIFLQPGAKTEAAVAQVTATSQNILKTLPPGLTPPLVISYSASSVPILQLGVSSPTMSESKLRDYAQNFVRIQLGAIRGAAVPSPYGGRSRVVMVDVDPSALTAKGLTTIDLANAINVQNLILPSGTAKMASREYTVSLNSSPEVLDALNDAPIKVVNGAMVYVRDVAHVRDGSAVQLNAVDKDGRPAVLLTVLKSGDASTLDVVQRVRDALPKIRSTLPEGLHLDIVSDQSGFVRASVNSVIHEGLTAALLTAIMILVFLGSSRSTFIIGLSIPIAILFSIICLKAIGMTLNVMTLGGLALAIGILVDNSIVTIENIYRNLGLGKTLRHAIIDGCEQIGAPQFVATLAICIVFLPIMFLSGATGSLFKPMAFSVVFAMVASFGLARTLVPVLAKMILGKEAHLHAHGHEDVGDKQRHHDHAKTHKTDGFGATPLPQGDWIWRLHLRFNRLFERLLDSYRIAIGRAMHHRGRTLIGFILIFLASGLFIPFVGSDFFPSVDAGSFRLHVRAPAGTRIEETRRLFSNVEHDISRIIPANQLDLSLDNIGIPVGGVNVAYNTSGAIGPSDGEILVQLKAEHEPTAKYVDQIRTYLQSHYPNVTFFFQPADITSQILNFGLPAPIDVQVVGKDASNYATAKEIETKLKAVPGALDVHVHQVVDAPDLHIEADTRKAQLLGITQRDIANNVLVTLSSSGQVMPNFWVNPRNGVSYLVAVQVPQYRENNLDALMQTPLTGGTNVSTEPLSNIAKVSRRKAAAVINHYDVQPTFDIYANVQGRDLGGVAKDVQKVIDSFSGKLPHGTSAVMRGQVESMNASFIGLGIGLIGSIFLVYLLLVVNYQSWVDPFIIISALGGALSGIIYMLFATNTTLSVPALMGSILCIGVGTANSILVVNFANDRRLHGDDAMTAAVTAGCTRLRPVLMTALAMILGMLPMSLALGEGGEQNAPLGRAVIGGLILATVTTLVFVPVLYSILKRNHPNRIEMEEQS